MKISRLTSVLLLCILFLILVGVTDSIYAGSYVGSWGNWSGSWSDRPREGRHSWYNYSSSVSWWTYYKWTVTKPSSGRDIELEFYDPANNNHCDRLQPTNLTIYGGNWISAWWISNQCGGSNAELLGFGISSSNVAVGSTYYVRATADILYTAGYGGETNVSYTCFLCSDDWLGKLNYDSGYNGTSSTP